MVRLYFNSEGARVLHAVMDAATVASVNLDLMKLHGVEFIGRNGAYIYAKMSRKAFNLLRPIFEVMPKNYPF